MIHGANTPSLKPQAVAPCVDAGYRHRLIPLSAEFIESATSQEKVAGSPHDLYKDPARFSPEFARQAINEFSGPGDTIIDCFCGGGTTLVEGVALGRRVIGLDISSLACFLATAKTTPLSIHDERQLMRWIAQVLTSPRD
jgi:hypothetical protein